ncbi:MAG: hypothetical protein V7782_16255 [Psychromonas sp.]
MHKLISVILILFSSNLFAEEVHPCYTPPDEANTNTIDIAYSYLTTKFCQPALWFDSFFVDSRATEDARAGTMIRWYTDLTWEKAESPAFGMKLNARLNLPRFSKKLKLVIESDDEEARVDSFGQPLASDEKDRTVGLQYDLKAEDRNSFNVKVTVRPSLEFRYRYTAPISAKTTFRFTQKLYQKRKVTGESSHVDFDHTINPKFVLRWANLARFESDVHDFELGTGLTLYQYISKRRAISYKSGVTWYTKSTPYVHNSHLSMVYRQNIFRKWLFYELIPEVNWDKEEDDGPTERNTKITFRLEVLFSNI